MNNRMVAKILLLVIATFFSCGGSKTTTNQLKENDVHLVNELIGQWYLCSEVIKGVESKYNVCPEIEFKKDGKGKITKPSKEEVDFMYTLDTNDKKFIFFIENNQSYFDEKEYYYKTYTENNLEILELSSKEGTSKYTLSRER